MLWELYEHLCEDGTLQCIEYWIYLYEYQWKIHILSCGLFGFYFGVFTLFIGTLPPPLLLKADTMKEKGERKFRLRLKPDFRKYFFIYWKCYYIKVY